LVHTYVNDIDAVQATGLFADDAKFQLPSLESIGLPPEFDGKAAIGKFLTHFHKDVFPNLPFIDVVVEIETPDRVMGEYAVKGKSAVSGKEVYQHFFVLLVAENGKIKLMRIALDTVVAADALLPGGLEEVVTKRHH
jgi:uncharacterized protein